MGKLLVVGVLLWAHSVAYAITPKCRALDANDGALILEVKNASATKCTAQLAAAMKKRRCGHAKGKQVEYMTQYDHKGVEGKLTTVTCGVAEKPELPKCRALDIKTSSEIAEVAQKSSTRCDSLLRAEVKKDRCTKKMRGKKVAYKVKFEHKGVKGRRETVACK
jgi:hypothetical protein